MVRPGSAGAANRAAPVLAILAGGRDRRSPIAGQVNRALLTFGGRTSLERILQAAEQSRAFGRILVVGPAELEPAIAAVALTTPVLLAGPSVSFADAITQAFAAAGLDAAERLYFATGDIPLLGAEELVRFVDAVERSVADVCMAFPRPNGSAPSARLLPSYRRSMLIAQGGPYLAGNLFALRSHVLEFTDVIERARRARRQSSIVNVLRALPAFAVTGLRSVPALRIWLRLVIVRTLWLRRGEYEWVPAAAPSTDQIRRAIVALSGGRLSVEFVDAGGAGACYDVDTLEEYEAVNALLRGSE